MRPFVDDQGREWDVVVGRESWGSLYALFVPKGETDRGVRQALLEALSLDEGSRIVNEMGEAELGELFRGSEPKSQG